jgi:hypothetical protein
MGAESDESSIVATTSERTRQSQLDEAVRLLRRHDVRVVAFDMDQTAVARHSRGCLSRDEKPMREFLDRATPDFVDILPALHGSGIGICIATHSDEAEYGGWIQPETHILGAELASALLARHFESDVAGGCLVVAYNPRARGREGSLEENRIKRYHVRRIQNHFGVTSPRQILLLDDLEDIVDDCRAFCGIHAVQVDGRIGFRLQDLLGYEFCCSPDDSK